MANEPNQQQKPTTPAKPWMWVINNTSRALGFPRKPVMSPVSKTSTGDSDVLTLAPGANLIAVKRWDILKAEDPDREVEGEKVKGEINRLLTDKIQPADHRNRTVEKVGSMHLVEVARVTNNKAPLEGLTDAEMLAIVEEIKDAAMLRSLIAIEKRAHVLVALQRNLSLYMTGFAKSAAA